MSTKHQSGDSTVALNKKVRDFEGMSTRIGPNFAVHNSSML